MAEQRKENNFYLRLQEKQHEKPQNVTRLRAALPALIVAAVCLLVLAGMGISGLVLRGSINTQQAWITDADHVAQYREAVEKQSFNSALIAKQQRVADTKAALQTYPEVDGLVMARIAQAGGDKISLAVQSYNAQTGILQFEASSPEVLDIPWYVRSLEDTGLFHEVTYSGYGYTTAVEGYRINVSCVLRAREGGK